VQFNGKQEPVLLQASLCCPRNGQQGAMHMSRSDVDATVFYDMGR
jgi:hypothetical protein